MEKLWEMDVDKSQIRLENFSSPMKPAAEETWRRRHEISAICWDLAGTRPSISAKLDDSSN
ncbi:unnamed protein product [Brassica napus]|uniref:(rape) hypothetical protein n=1 Tax=Brassica napus TaxID=3708 RepID=A0A816JKH3_BRANA|nr:unnamed protein product [Brassica napus]